MSFPFMGPGPKHNRGLAVISGLTPNPVSVVRRPEALFLRPMPTKVLRASWLRKCVDGPKGERLSLKKWSF